MYRLFLKMMAIALLMNWLAHGQSLGEVARQNRDKQKAKDASSTAKPEVITNENLPKSPDAEPTPPASGAKTPAPPHVSSGGQSAEQWKNQILAQKKVIAALQAQIDKLSDSIHFVVAAEYYNGVQYNQRQAKKQEMVTQMQQQLEEEKQRLDEMQEAARQAGFGNAVYDP